MNQLKMFRGKKFHFIGIGGVSMSALAQMLKRAGFYVQGSDEIIGEELKRLAKKKIRVFVGHSKSNVLGVDVVVLSSAIHEDNPELVYAKKNNLVILKRAELLGMIAESYKTVIAVAGSHGKTTATAMLSEIFMNAGLKPTVHIGGRLKSINSNYQIGNKKYFITENCEYKDNFLFVRPDISLILNIDSDHLDYFKDLNGVQDSFYKYALGIKPGGLNLVFDGDDNSKQIRCLENCVTFGYDKSSDMYACDVKEYKPGYFSFNVVFQKCKLGEIKLNIIGKHNVINALACTFIAFICGVDFEVIKESIEKYSGVERRGERIGFVNGAEVYHDYAHHPAQIAKMIEATRRMLTCESKLITIFEPHTYSRTKYLLVDFAKSFIGSDYVFFAPVYSARESEEEGVNSEVLFVETRKYVENVECNKTYKEIINKVQKIIKKGDFVLVLGAGNIEKLAKLLVE